MKSIVRALYLILIFERNPTRASQYHNVYNWLCMALDLLWPAHLWSWPDRVYDSMKKGQIHRPLIDKLGLGGLWALMEMHQQPRDSAYLGYSTEWGGGFTVYSWTGSGFTVYSWMRRWLASLGRRSLSRAISGCSHPGGGSVDSFCRQSHIQGEKPP